MGFVAMIACFGVLVALARTRSAPASGHTHRETVYNRYSYLRINVETDHKLTRRDRDMILEWSVTQSGTLPLGVRVINTNESTARAGE